MKTELRCDICGAVMIYDDFNEVALITRTFADWVYSSDGFQDTKESKGPPQKNGSELLTSNINDQAVIN